MSYGRAYVAFSIANQSYPRTGLQTYYTFTISNLNQSITGSFVKGFGLRVTAIMMQDNYLWVNINLGHWRQPDRRGPSYGRIQLPDLRAPQTPNHSNISALRSPPSRIDTGQDTE